MSDWGGLDNDAADLSDYLEPSVPGVPTPVGPLVSPLELGKISRSPGVSPPSRQETVGLRAPMSAPRARPTRAKGLGAFGAFTPQAVCELKALARLAYLFYVNVSTGDTANGLAVLGVFRALWNDSRARIAPGFTMAIPGTLSEVAWTSDMQVAVGLSLIGALGDSSPARAPLASQPGNMAAIATWFSTFRSALGPEDASIMNYANTPTSGDYATAIASIARDDLSACLAATSAPAPSVQAPAPGTPYVLSPTTSVANTTMAPRAGGSSSSITGSSSTVITIALLGLVGVGAWLAFKDGSKAKTEKLSGIDMDGLEAKAKRAAALDAPKMKCLPTAVARARVSMDETAGRRGEKLAEKLQELPPKEALRIEEIYFLELDRIRPGAPRCIG